MPGNEPTKRLTVKGGRYMNSDPWRSIAVRCTAFDSTRLKICNRTVSRPNADFACDQQGITESRKGGVKGKFQDVFSH